MNTSNIRVLEAELKKAILDLEILLLEADAKDSLHKDRIDYLKALVGYNTDGWIRNTGSVMRLPSSSTIVNVKLRNGEAYTGPVRSFRWVFASEMDNEYNKGNDIIFFRTQEV